MAFLLVILVLELGNPRRHRARRRPYPIRQVTGETLGEGMHLINPLKTNNEMSIQTQTLKESASVPSSEGLMMALDTSLIYHLNPDRAAEVFQKIGADYEDCGG